MKAFLIAFLPFLLGVACGGSKNERPPSDTPLAVGSSSASASATPSAPPPATTAADPEPPPGSLLARIGGRAVLVKVIDSLVKAIEANPKLHLRFASVLGSPRAEDFKKNLVDELCVASGGKCNYRGRSMKDAHRSLHVTEAEWNAFMSDLQSALDENHIGQTEQLDLLTVLTPMRASVIDATGRRR